MGEWGRVNSFLVLQQRCHTCNTYCECKKGPVESREWGFHSCQPTPPPLLFSTAWNTWHQGWVCTMYALKFPDLNLTYGTDPSSCVNRHTHPNLWLPLPHRPWGSSASFSNCMTAVFHVAASCDDTPHFFSLFCLAKLCKHFSWNGANLAPGQAREQPEPLPRILKSVGLESSQT